MHRRRRPVAISFYVIPNNIIKYILNCAQNELYFMTDCFTVLRQRDVCKSGL